MTCRVTALDRGPEERRYISLGYTGDDSGIGESESNIFSVGIVSIDYYMAPPQFLETTYAIVTFKFLVETLTAYSNAGSKRHHVHDCSLVQAKKFYGYHSSEELLFAKIYLSRAIINSSIPSTSNLKHYSKVRHHNKFDRLSDHFWDDDGEGETWISDSNSSGHNYNDEE
ncbi:hypothetical protein LguiA_007599 [Lonicera macranthoides]